MRKFITIGASAIAIGLGACQDSPLDVSNPTPSSFAIVYDANGLPRFVGKGDVQTFFGWNNQKLQQNAEYVAFEFGESASWTCTKHVENPGNPHDIVLQRHTTVQALITTQGRDTSEGRNGPNTGFVLTPSGTPTHQGPALGSCPADPSGFVFDDNLTTSGGLKIRLTGGPLGPTGWLNFP